MLDFIEIEKFEKYKALSSESLNNISKNISILYKEVYDKELNLPTFAYQSVLSAAQLNELAKPLNELKEHFNLTENEIPEFKKYSILKADDLNAIVLSIYNVKDSILKERDFNINYDKELGE